MSDRLKILLVDDEPGIVRLVSKRLEVEGFDVVGCMDGTQAMIQVQAVRPDLIILDVMLPGVNGHEVCRRLKRDPGFKNIPIILFTAKTSLKDEGIALEHGADAYIRKPFRAKELIEAIRALMQDSCG